MSDRTPTKFGDRGLPVRWQSSRARRILGWSTTLGLVLALSSFRADAGAKSSPLDDPAMLCDAAAVQASRESGVPLEVLQAISLTETGRRRDGVLRPWPWTVNMEGRGDWFDTREQALAHVEANYTRGARSFDVGCFQLNFRWHGNAFRSFGEMFDPLANARYAARFLAELHAELGDWSQAAGAYHSRTPEYARRYRGRFDTILSRLDGAVQSRPTHDDPSAGSASGEVPHQRARLNSFPLLQTGLGPTSLGSLVPLEAGRAIALFGPASSGLDDAL